MTSCLTRRGSRPFRHLLAAAVCAVALGGCLNAESPEEPAISDSHVSVVVRLDPDELRDRLTAYRAAHHLCAVTLDPGLMALAQSQANAMARANHLSHEIAGSLDHRLNAAHHAKGYAVENVSAGYATADAALRGWEHSPGHNANLLDGKMHRLGIAAADAPGTRYKTYWALMMTD